MLKTIMPLALLLAAAPQIAQANEFDGARVRVAYADLNLATAAGVAELDARIDKAVKAVCPSPKTKRLVLIQATEACRVTALRSVEVKRAQVIAARTGTIQVAAGR